MVGVGQQERGGGLSAEASRYNKTRWLSWLRVCAGVWSVTTYCLTVTFLLTKREIGYGGGGAEGQWDWKGLGMAESPPLTVRFFQGPGLQWLPELSWAPWSDWGCWQGWCFCTNAGARP